MQQVALNILKNTIITVLVLTCYNLRLIKQNQKKNLVLELI